MALKGHSVDHCTSFRNRHTGTIVASLLRYKLHTMIGNIQQVDWWNEGTYVLKGDANIPTTLFWNKINKVNKKLPRNCMLLIKIKVKLVIKRRKYNGCLLCI